MNKKLFLLAAAAMSFASCSDNFESLEEQPPVEQQLADGAITFGAYVNRTTASTRAGQTGTLAKGDYDDTESVQTGLGRSGFGVFAYYTGSELYAADSYKPDFMYNQRVYNTSKTAGTYTWNYEPVKYWPNEFGAGAVSDEIDRLTFFAYAPYVSVTPSTGNVRNASTTTAVTSASDDQYYTEDNGDAKTGIIGMSRNSASSDPYIKYAVSLDPAQCVDLCYGVAGTAFAREGLGAVAAGGNLVDLTKPAVGDKISFDFKHALAALNVQIDAAVDDLVPGKDLGTNANGTVDTKTRIYVRSIQFEGLTDRGMLNLRDHAWYDMTTSQAGLTGTLKLQDGRSDGREAVMVATNETNVALNPDIIQVGVSTKPGVTKTAVNLFNDPVATNAIYVIPTGQELRVTVVYDVETQDDNLSGYLSGSNTHGISVENAITQTVSSGFTLRAGQAYTLKLHLGMNSVKFDVNEIDEWPTTTTNAETSLSANISGSLADVKTAIDAADATTFANLQQLYVGKFVNADGSIASAKTATTVGVIAQLSKTDVDAGVVDSRILVMAAEDVVQNGGTSTSFPWRETNTALSGSSTDVFEIAAASWQKFSDETPDATNSSTANTCRSGRLNGYQISSDNNAAENYAIYTAFNYDLTTIDGITEVGYGTGATSGAQGHWFLPTVEQMINMGASKYRYYSSIGATNDSYPKSGVMATFSGNIWSSSEYSGTFAWTYYATNGNWYNSGKAARNAKVRPVFAY